MNVDQLLELLAETEVFSSLQQNELAQLARVMEFREYSPGQVLVRQNDVGEEFFILVEGSARVVRENKVLKTERAILTLRAGQSLGETSLLSNEPRSATVKALEKTVCAVLTRANFHELFEKVPAVSRVMARYLAQRLAAQCQLEGPQFVSLAQFPHRPELFRLIPINVLEQCEAAPLHLDGRLLTIAMVQPNNLSQIELLKDELPGFQLEAAGCSNRELKEYLAVQKRSEAVQRDYQIETTQKPLDELVRLMISESSGFVALEFESDASKLLVKKGHQLQNFSQQPGEEFFRLAHSVLTSSFLSHSGQDQTVKSTIMGNQTHYFQISRFKHRIGTRYSLQLLNTRAQPLSAYLPSPEMQFAVRECLSAEQSILLLDGAPSSLDGAFMSALIRDQVERFGSRGVLYVGEPNESLKVNCTFAVRQVDLSPYLESSIQQGVQLAAVPNMERRNWLELMNFQGRLPALIGAWQGGGSAKSCLSFLTERFSAPDSCFHEFHLMSHKLGRRICSHCCSPASPSKDELRELKTRTLHNEESSYFRGEGCEKCGQTGRLGEIAIIWLSNVRHTSDGVLKLTDIWSTNDYLRSVLKNGNIDVREALRLSPG